MKRGIFVFAMISVGAAIGAASTIAAQKFFSRNGDGGVKVVKEASNPFSFFDEDFLSYDPFDEIRKERERIREDFFSDEKTFFSGLDEKFDRLKMEASGVSVKTREEDDFLIYEVSGEGIDEKSIDVKVSDGVVTISGRLDKKSTKEKDGAKSVFSTTSQFNQSFTVPYEVNTERVKMEHADGKILIKFPKRYS